MAGAFHAVLLGHSALLDSQLATNFAEPGQENITGVSWAVPGQGMGSNS